MAIETKGMSKKACMEKGGELSLRLKEMAKKIQEEDRAFSANEDKNWKELNADVTELSKRIAWFRQLEQADTINGEMLSAGEPIGPERVIAEPVGSPESRTLANAEDRAYAMQAWATQKPNKPITERQQKACQLVGIDPRSQEIDLRLRTNMDAKFMQRQWRSVHISRAFDHALSQIEQRALATSPGSAGGDTIPEGFVNQLEINMLAFGQMLQTSDIMRTATGNDMPWPTADDTGNIGEQLAEGTTIGASVDPTFAQILFKAWKFSSKPVLVSTELLEDSAFDLPGVLGEMLGVRLGRILNQKFTLGAGTTEPSGIVTDATLGVTAASATAFTWEETVSLVHSVDIAYRTGNNSGFMANDAIWEFIRLFASATENLPIWQPGLQDGQPDRYLGYPIFYNQDMADTLAIDAKVLLFGQLGKYKVRQVNSFRARRLDERYADTDQVAFISFLRADGHLLDAGTAPVKFLQMAAA